MKRARCHMPPVIILLCITLTACDWMPGKPVKPEVDRGNPESVHDFSALWKTNCQGCHGASGRWGPARPLNDPLYQALVTDDWLRSTIANGVEGTLMPPHAQQNGGWMTDQQIDVIVTGMRSRWRTSPPAYAAASPAIIHFKSGSGDLHRGQETFNTYCSSCHGHDGVGGSAGSPIDGSFLALASDQMLRATIVCGRPDLGMPDWQWNLNGVLVPEQSGLAPLTDGQIDDLMAWLTSHRQEFPGQPYPSTGNNQPGYRSSGSKD